MRYLCKISVIAIILINTIVFFEGCKKENNDNSDNQHISSTGQVIFWVSEDVGYVTISVDGQNAGTIKGHYYGTYPECGDSRCLTITLSGGSHNYTATGNIGNISNRFTVVSGTCNNIKIF